MLNHIWFVWHIRREQTEAAHHLSTAALHQSLEQVWREDSPTFIQKKISYFLMKE
jgi:hypothetical protein